MRVETIDMPWGPRLIPVDEIERLVAESDDEQHRHLPGERLPVAPPAAARQVIERISA